MTWAPCCGGVPSRRASRKVIERYHLHVNLSAYVGALSIGEQQKVEILKLLLSNARILIFDEPPACWLRKRWRGFSMSLPAEADGFAILFITHKLPEVMATADRITVLRRGAVVGQMLRTEASPQAIVRLMLGSEDAPLLELGVPQPALAHSAPQASSLLVVELERVTVADDYGGIGLYDGLLMPTTLVTAPKSTDVDQIFPHVVAQLHPLELYRLSGLLLPCSLSPDGLPVGAQLVTAPLQDGLMVALASALNAVGDWRNRERDSDRRRTDADRGGGWPRRRCSSSTCKRIFCAAAASAISGQRSRPAAPHRRADCPSAGGGAPGGHDHHPHARGHLPDLSDCPPAKLDR